MASPILQPLFCCPIYQMADGRYLLVHHPAFGGKDPGNSSGPKSNRRPAFVAVGEFHSGAEQPIWFSESRLLMDNDGVGMGPLNRVDIGGYTSFTTQGRQQRVVASGSEVLFIGEEDYGGDGDGRRENAQTLKRRKPK